MKLGDATALKVGTATATKAMRGTQQVWPTGVCNNVLREPFDNLFAWTASSFVVGVGRTGFGATCSSLGTIEYTIPVAQRSSTVTYGFAFRVGTWPAAVSTIARLREGGSDHIGIDVNTSTGAVLLKRGATTIGTSAAGLITTNAWYYVEVQTRIAHTGGFVTVRLNGTSLFTLTNTDTQGSGATGVVDAVRLSGPSSATIVYDDLYLTTGPDCPLQGSQAIGPPLAVDSQEIIYEPFNDKVAWSAPFSTVVAGRTGTALSLTGSSNNASRYIDQGRMSGCNIIGFAWRVSDLTATRGILSLDDSGSTDHVSLRANTDGSLTVTRGNTGGTVLVTTAAGLVAANTWAYIELKAVIDHVQGSVIVRVNGTEVANVANINTRSGTPMVNMVGRVNLLSPGSTGTTLVDDLYMTAGLAATFKGDQTMTAPVPAVPSSVDLVMESFSSMKLFTPSATVDMSLAPGRTGTCLHNTGAGGLTTYLNYFRGDYFISPGSIVVFGLAFRLSSLAATRDICSLRVAGGGAALITLRVNTNGSITVLGATSLTIGTTPAGLVAVDTWVYVEVKVKHGNTTGACEVRVNGTTAIGPLTNVDTNAGYADTEAYASLALVGLSGVVCDYDDVYVSTGASCTFKGPIAIP